MLPLQGSRRGATKHSNMAAERLSDFEKRPTIADMAMDDGAAEGGSAAVAVGPAFLTKFQVKGMHLTILSCLLSAGC